IVGVAVDDWTVDHLLKRARESIERTGETIDSKIFERFAARLSYVSGDFTDAARYERVGAAMPRLRGVRSKAGGESPGRQARSVDRCPDRSRRPPGRREGRGRSGSTAKPPRWGGGARLRTRCCCTRPSSETRRAHAPGRRRGGVADDAAA